MVTGPKQAELIAVLGDIPLSDTEQGALARVSEFEDATVEIIVGLISRARVRSATLASRAARKEWAQWDVRPWSDVDALREAARRLRAGANVGENPRSAIAAGLRGVADTFDAWADETRLRDQPMRCSIAAMARVILEDAE